jgi:hypothetical protein
MHDLKPLPIPCQPSVVEPVVAEGKPVRGGALAPAILDALDQIREEGLTVAGLAAELGRTRNAVAGCLITLLGQGLVMRLWEVVGGRGRYRYRGVPGRRAYLGRAHAVAHGCGATSHRVFDALTDADLVVLAKDLADMGAGKTPPNDADVAAVTFLILMLSLEQGERYWAEDELIERWPLLEVAVGMEQLHRAGVAHRQLDPKGRAVTGRTTYKHAGGDA